MESTTATTPAQPAPAAEPRLDYAPAAPLRRRQRLIALLLLLAAAGAAGAWGGPKAYRQAQYLSLQRQCLTYRAPPDQVVLEPENTAAAALAQQPGYTLGSRGLFDEDTYAVHNPPCLDKFEAAVFGPTSAFPFKVPPSATVFCHERVSARGVRRLVVLRRDGSFEYQFVENFSVTLIDPAPFALSSAARLVAPPHQNVSGAFVHWLGPPPPVRYYAGQPDSSDPARFTIRYCIDGRGEGSIEGKLNDAGDGVTIRVSEWAPQVLKSKGQ